MCITGGGSAFIALTINSLVRNHPTCRTGSSKAHDIRCTFLTAKSCLCVKVTSADEGHGGRIYPTDCAQPVGRYKGRCEVGEGLGACHNMSGLPLWGDEVEAVVRFTLLHLHWSKSCFLRRCSLCLEPCLVAGLTQVVFTMVTVVHWFRRGEGEWFLSGVFLSAIITVPSASSLWVHFTSVTHLQGVRWVVRMGLGGSCVATDAEPKPASGVTASVIVGVVDGMQTVGAGVAEEVILDVHTDQPVLV